MQRRRADIRQLPRRRHPVPERPARPSTSPTSSARRTATCSTTCSPTPASRSATAPAAPAAASAGGPRWRCCAPSPPAREPPPPPCAPALTSPSSRDADEIDALGRAGVLDSGDDETLEGIDATPGALIDRTTTRTTATPADTQRTAPAARLRRAGRRARRTGARPQARRGHRSRSRALLAGGYAPIVFCRFIHTADYVAEHLSQRARHREEAGARRRCHRRAAAGRTGAPRRRAHRPRRRNTSWSPPTACPRASTCRTHSPPSLHYDLAWNPTRHEQREGRVDRFGQRKDVVRAVTLYGEDNGIDGIVLDVLIRKHRAIAKATGVAVPVPGDGQAVIDALAEGLLLRGHDQQSAAPRPRSRRARASRSTLALAVGRREGEGVPHPLRAEHHQGRRGRRRGRRDPRRARRATATSSTSSSAPCARSAPPSPRPTTAMTAVLATLPLGARGQPARRAARPAACCATNPRPAAASAAITRTDPVVQALARYVLESRARPGRARSRPSRSPRRRHAHQRRHHPHHAAASCGCGSSSTSPTSRGTRQLVAEDARVLAFEGAPPNADWLPDARAEQLLAATPSGNVVEGVAQDALTRIVDGLPDLAAELDVGRRPAR